MMPATSGLIADDSTPTGEAPPLPPPAPPNSPLPASLLYKVADEELIQNHILYSANSQLSTYFFRSHC
jgi:hypothetical protein